MLPAPRYLALLPTLAMACMVGPRVDRRPAHVSSHEQYPAHSSAPLHLFTPAPFVDDGPSKAALGTNHFEQDWQTRVSEDIRRSEYHIHHQEHVGALQSPNRAQDLRITYHTDGFSLTPRVEGDAWRTELRVASIGRNAQRLTPVAMPKIDVRDRAATVDHGSFSMHYTNDERGMRQDFTVRQRPAGIGPLEVRLRYEGTLHATAQGEDDILFSLRDTGTFTPCVWYRDLQAWDADGDTLDARAYVDGDAIVLAVDDARARYPVTIDPLSTTTNWVSSGTTQAGAMFGISFSTAGDVNGDGYSDVIIGAPFYDGALPNVGRIYIYHGSPTGLATTPAATRQQNVEQAAFGNTVSTAGDLNGDGYSDVAAIEPGWLGPDRLFIYHGSDTGIGTLPATTLNLPTEGTQGSDFWAMACAGDVDADGFSDLVIGRSSYSTVNAQVGRAYIYHGSAGGLEATPRRTLTGSRYDARFGCAVASAGDVNGDGCSDIVIGEPGWSNGANASDNYEGRAAVYYGVPGVGIGATPSWSYESNINAGELGFAVSWAGDVNGDGYGDIIVGLPWYELDGWNPQRKGMAMCFHGSAAGLAATPARTWEGIDLNERFGWSMSGAGDVNGDGYADVIIGSPGTYSTYRGAASVFLGGATGLAATATWRVIGPSLFSEEYGLWVCTAGDVNGDGYSDVIVSDPKYNSGPIAAQVVDVGRAFVYHGSPEGLGTTAGTRDGSQDHARFGWSVSTAGDVNRDGYSDVVIGAPLYDAGQTDEGRAFLYLGAAGGLATTAAWTAESDQNNAQFGYCVSTAGDVNGDGYSDVIIGAPYFNGGEAGEGRAYLFQGINTAAGLSATAAATRESDQINAHFGWSVNTAGDVNGDGYSDVIIGAPDYDNGETDEGRAYVYLGGTGFLDASWTTESDQAGAQLGAAVAGGGDVNGDGYGDVIIGVPLYDGTFVNEGQARIHAGWVNGLLDAPLWTATGGKANSSFGGAVAMAGDVDANGRTDVIVGAPFYDVATATSNEGRASLFLSGPEGPPPSPTWVVNGGAANANLGFSVSKAGDVNGDGYGDIVVGSPGWGNGRMQAYHGSPTGPSTTPTLEISGAQSGQRYGTSVSNSGSQSGDGYGDVVVGSPQYDVTIWPSTFTDRGRAYLYNGNEGRTLTARTRQYRPNLTTPVQPGNGTFSGDCGWGIGQVARSSTGRRRMKLVWEVTGHGPPFSNAGGFVTNSVDQSGQSATWSNSSSPTEIKQALTNTASAYPKWRVRLRHHPATMIDGQPFGRWYYFGIHDRQEPAVKTTTPDCGLLPVELLSFNGACTGRNIDLNWATASEQDNAYFTLWHSSDHEMWTEVDRIPGSMHSQRVTHYRYEHVVTAPSGSHYYRLAQTDADGTTKFVANIHVPVCGSPTSTFLLHPNPATDMLHVTLGADTPDGDRELQCVDGQGRIVLKRMLSQGLAHAVDVSTLPPGLYLFRLHIDGAATGNTERLIKQ